LNPNIVSIDGAKLMASATPSQGLSAISCVAGDFTLRRHGSDEAIAEDDGELRLGH
jgi:hypothetical protein